MPRYEYPRPALTADCCVFRPGATNWEVLLVKRAADPFKGKWALPGGYVNEGECAAQAAGRELSEETGVEFAEVCQQVGFYDTPGRDPRGWVVSCAYFFQVPAGTEAVAGDDAAEAQWVPIDDFVTFTGLAKLLAFDHADILAQAIDLLPVFPQPEKPAAPEKSPWDQAWDRIYLDEWEPAEERNCVVTFSSAPPLLLKGTRENEVWGEGAEGAVRLTKETAEAVKPLLKAHVYPKRFAGDCRILTLPPAPEAPKQAPWEPEFEVRCVHGLRSTRYQVFEVGPGADRNDVGDYSTRAAAEKAALKLRCENYPRVGDGVTMGIGSDRYPYEVIEVLKPGKTIRVSRCNPHLPDYPLGADPNATQILTRRKNGRWVSQGLPINDCTRWGLGHKSYHQDPSF